MSGEVIDLSVLRSVYHLAVGSPGVGIAINDVGRRMDLPSFRVSGQLALLVRLGYLAVAEGGHAVALTDQGIDLVEEQRFDLRPITAVGPTLAGA